jgi:hypothetical protein
MASSHFFAATATSVVVIALSVSNAGTGYGNDSGIDSSYVSDRVANRLRYDPSAPPYFAPMSDERVPTPMSLAPERAPLQARRGTSWYGRLFGGARERRPIRNGVERKDANV